VRRVSPLARKLLPNTRTDKHMATREVPMGGGGQGDGTGAGQAKNGDVASTDSGVRRSASGAR